MVLKLCCAVSLSVLSSLVSSAVLYISSCSMSFSFLFLLLHLFSMLCHYENGFICIIGGILQKYQTLNKAVVYRCVVLIIDKFWCPIAAVSFQVITLLCHECSMLIYYICVRSVKMHPFRKGTRERKPKSTNTH